MIKADDYYDQYRALFVVKNPQGRRKSYIFSKFIARWIKKLKNTVKIGIKVFYL
jgi:hypothetical protein